MLDISPDNLGWEWEVSWWGDGLTRVAFECHMNTWMNTWFR